VLGPRPLHRPLRAGDAIFVVGPSGPFDEGLFEAGLALLRQHYRLIVPAGLAGRRSGFLAGSDSERQEELEAAFRDPTAGAIWLARGGYGLARLAPTLDWSALLARPRWLVGFSDATVLHLGAQARGLVSLHAPNVTTLSGTSEGDFAALVALLEAPWAPHQLTGLRPAVRAAAESEVIVGPLVGGNLTVLFAEAVAGRLQLPADHVLFLEDVTETSYRVDRMLTALEQGGHLRQTRAVVLGDFEDCSPGKFEVPVELVLRERLAPLGVPVLSGMPVGHGAQNQPLLLGAAVELDCAAGVLRWAAGVEG
jgi:muramoyltetrapeptide carboxypeptidase